MNMAPHDTANVNGIKVRYVEVGDRPSVVLLPSFPEISFAWYHQIPALAEHYRVIAPDLRGYGGTEKPLRL
jgi:pimeloyl-ACP methyl ester carboxylesterase